MHSVLNGDMTCEYEIIIPEDIMDSFVREREKEMVINGYYNYYRTFSLSGMEIIFVKEHSRLRPLCLGRKIPEAFGLQQRNDVPGCSIRSAVPLQPGACHEFYGSFSGKGTGGEGRAFRVERGYDLRVSGTKDSGSLWTPAAE